MDGDGDLDTALVISVDREYQGHNFMNAKWFDSPSVNQPYTGASGTAIGTGASNTATIVNAIDSWLSDNGYPLEINTSAAKICSIYENYGYNDWYMPSIDELYQLCINREAVNQGIESIIGTNSNNFEIMAQVWSSSEYSVNAAYHIILGDSPWCDNSPGAFNKSLNKRYRPIRAH